MRRCTHATPDASCPFCRIAQADPRYARLLEANRAPARHGEPKQRGTCRHLGADTGDLAACESCAKGRVRLKVHECARHGRCVRAGRADGLQSCQGCPDHEEAERPLRRFPIRDCLYHVCPFVGSAESVWRSQLAYLARRASLFTGRRICATMTGGGLASPDDVRAILEPAGFDIVEVANDPNLREAKSLPIMLEMVQSRDPARALWFGHAKGVTRPINHGVTCHPWANMLHEIHLDYWGAVERGLSDAPITGAFKKIGRGFAGSRSQWHYSGSFFWVRSADLFSRGWREIDQIRFGVEPYPSLHFTEEEAGCLFHEGRVPGLDLYRMEYLHGVLVEYNWWRQENDHLRTEFYLDRNAERATGQDAGAAENSGVRHALAGKRESVET